MIDREKIVCDCCVHGVEMTQPKFLVRPDDHAIFSLNENGTYSINSVKNDGHLHHEYSGQQLRNLGFYECGEEDLPHHHQFQEKAVICRTDGHGDEHD